MSLRGQRVGRAAEFQVVRWKLSTTVLGQGTTVRMRRRQLFEFEDLEWFPSLIRDYMTDFLGFVSEKFDLFGPVVPILRDVLHRTGCRQIVDLGSGGGGAWRMLAPRLSREIEGLTVTLTDLYPNRTALAALAAAEPKTLRFAPEPVDATDVPANLMGLRTQFLSLHHFTPVVATAMLANAVKAEQPIAVFEAQRRDIEHVFKAALEPVMVLLLTPLIRPIRPGRLLLTYLPPVVPFFVLWDGLVSVLRTYTAEEMLALAKAADVTDAFEWECGELRNRMATIPYLIGWPGRAST